MCGIAGYINFHENENTINNMLQSIAHRGPDETSHITIDNFVGGMVRLSINDLDKGSQPLFNQDKSVILFYNGEIYNSPELRAKLKKKGYNFKSNSDGEVICHLYDEYGDDLFSLLDGMFAISLYDTNKRILYLARDFSGEKPLYYSDFGLGKIVFSSEIKALLKFPKINKKLNHQAIWDFPSFLFIPEPNTIFSNIKALQRGSILKIDDKNLSIKKYKPEIYENIDFSNSHDIVAETKKVVIDAVKSRLLSDVPIGSFLSGGLDSSIVATIATKYLGPIDTFCIGFEKISDPYHGSSDESIEASSYAKKLNSRHHSVNVTSKDFKKDLRDFCKFGDQPFAVSSGLGVLSIAKEAKKRGVKVLLSGDCADECFGGYSWYEYLNHIDYDFSNKTNFSPISFQNFGLKVKNRLKILETYNSHQRAWAWHYYAHEDEKRNLFSDDLLSDTKSSIRHFKEFDNSKKWKPIDYIAHDRNFYMPYEMLTKVDRMTMAHSVEGRVPFASPSVIMHADKLKFGDMVQGNTLKWTLRKAFEDILPIDVVKRPKHGFNVPIDFWLNNEWSDLVEDTFSQSSSLYKNNFIDSKSIFHAKKMLADKNRLNGHSIFCFIMLNLWLEEFN